VEKAKMPKNYEAREKKLKRRRDFIPDNRRSIFLEVDMRNKRDKMLAERAAKRERRERGRIHRESAQYTY
jgi:hypothetical protein